MNHDFKFIYEKDYDVAHLRRPSAKKKKFSLFLSLMSRSILLILSICFI